MSNVYVDIRNENESIQDLFSKDFVSVDDLLDCIDDLNYQLDKLKEELEDLHNPDENKGVWEMFDLQYKEQRMREMEGLE